MTTANSKIKFTVIIPTRDRSDTLEWALKTCTEQNYENFEIIVSDNFSQDSTRQVVESNSDKRIRYINTGKRVSMTSNYEFALSHATGDYVCIIGDDDGLIPDALEELNDILSKEEIEAVSWKKNIYFWNQFYSENLRNTLHVSFKNNAKKYDSSQLLEKLLTFDPTIALDFNNLACLYHGFVKRETIDKLRLPDGRFFNSILPDVYASLVISFGVKSVYQTNKSYTLHGISKHSTGYASENTQSLQKFLSEADIPPHPNIKVVPVSAVLCTAECLLKVQENFPAARKIQLDVKAMINKAMKEAVAMPAENYVLVAEAVTYTCKAFGIEDYGKQKIAENPNFPIKSPFIPGYNFVSKFLVLKFNNDVKNIYDATEIYQKINGKNTSRLYLREINRFLSGVVKTYGIRNSINKGIRRLYSKLGFIS